MRVCEDWLLVELGMPAATGTFDGEHRGAGRRKNQGKDDGREKEGGISGKSIFLYK